MRKMVPCRSSQAGINCKLCRLYLLDPDTHQWAAEIPTDPNTLATQHNGILHAVQPVCYGQCGESKANTDRELQYRQNWIDLNIIQIQSSRMNLPPALWRCMTHCCLIQAHRTSPRLERGAWLSCGISQPLSQHQVREWCLSDILHQRGVQCRRQNKALAHRRGARQNWLRGSGHSPWSWLVNVFNTYLVSSFRQLTQERAPTLHSRPKMWSKRKKYSRNGRSIYFHGEVQISRNMVGMVCCCNYMSEGGGGTGMFSSENWLLDRLVNALRMVDVVTLMMSWPVFFSLWEGIDKLRTLNISKEVRMSSKSLCCCDTGNGQTKRCTWHVAQYSLMRSLFPPPTFVAYRGSRRFRPSTCVDLANVKSAMA